MGSEAFDALPTQDLIADMESRFLKREIKCVADYWTLLNTHEMKTAKYKFYHQSACFEKAFDH